jgi:hypothetical protein
MAQRYVIKGQNDEFEYFQIEWMKMIIMKTITIPRDRPFNENQGIS